MCQAFTVQALCSVMRFKKKEKKYIFISEENVEGKKNVNSRMNLAGGTDVYKAYARGYLCVNINV